MRRGILKPALARAGVTSSSLDGRQVAVHARALGQPLDAALGDLANPHTGTRPQPSSAGKKLQ